MRIAVIAPVWFPVPPPGYGGIELVVSLLADGLVLAGHEVTLFASGDSHTKARLEYVFAEAPSASIGITEVEFRHALACYRRAGDFDVVNDHSGPYCSSLGRRGRDAGCPHRARPARRRRCGGLRRAQRGRA